MRTCSDDLHWIFFHVARIYGNTLANSYIHVAGSHGNTIQDILATLSFTLYR